MVNLALWLKRNKFRADQVQTFYPSPMALATAMYHSEKNPLKKVDRDSKHVPAVRSIKQRRLHKAFLRYHDSDNWPALRDALKKIGRRDLIGNGPMHLVPSLTAKKNRIVKTEQHRSEPSIQSSSSKRRVEGPERCYPPSLCCHESSARRSFR